MKNNALIIILLITAAAFAVMMSTCSRGHNWTLSLDEGGDEPYDVSVFAKLLRHGSGSDRYTLVDYDLEKFLNEARHEKTLYVYQGLQPRYNRDELRTFKDFIYRGNHALITGPHLPAELIDSIAGTQLSHVADGDSVYYKPLTTLPTFRDTAVEVILQPGDVSARLFYRIVDKTGNYKWAYFGDSLLAEIPSAKIHARYDGGKPLLIEIPGERGSVFFCSQPLLFTNFHLKRKPVFDVVNGILELSDPEYILHDVSRTFYSGVNRSFDRGPLDYLFTFPSFRKAWAVLLFAALAFLAVNYKRERRAMPLIPSKDNRSLAFIETVGLLYYKNNANLQIARIASDVFLFNLKRKYGITTSKLDDDFIDITSKKTGRERHTVKQLTLKIKSFNGLRELSEHSLLEFFNLLKTFRDRDGKY